MYLWDYNFIQIFLVTNWQNMVTSDDNDSDGRYAYYLRDCGFILL